ncbi:MAG: hypothetical protein ACN6N0_08805 [Microvirgula sp.]
MKRIVWMGCLAGLGLSASALGAEPLRITEVGNDMLANMRGKYVAPGQIVSFGLEMVTSWQTQAGDTQSAAVKFAAAQGNGFLPTITVYQSGNKDGAAAAAGTGTVVQTDLSTVKGVSQGIQIAGDSNHVGNGISVEVGPAGATAQGLTAGMTPVGTLSASGTTTLQAGNVLAALQSGRLSLSMAVAGQGTAQQGIGNGNLSQQTAVISSHNQVTNLARQTVNIDAASLHSSTVPLVNLMRGIQ